MEQNLSNMVILALLKKENHPRALSKELGTNHTIIIRRLNELQEENVVDSKKEGRNKSFFIKKTAEARNRVLISELQVLTDFVRKHPELRSLIDRVWANRKVSLAMIFGSYAKGLENKNSDIDLFVLTDDRRLKKELELLDSRLNIKIGRSWDASNPLIREIQKNHVIVKGAETYYGETGLF